MFCFSTFPSWKFGLPMKFEVQTPVLEVPEKKMNFRTSGDSIFFLPLYYCLYFIFKSTLSICAEITKVRTELFGPGPTNGVECSMPTVQGEPIKLPTPSGNKVKLAEKVYAPVKDHPKVS